MPQTYKWPVAPGDFVMVVLPYSEVCLHMGVAGKPMRIEVRKTCVQLYNERGAEFSAPITHGEAGVLGVRPNLYVYAVPLAEEELLVQRSGTHYVNGADEQTPFDESEHIAKYAVDGTYVCDLGAPGYGRMWYYVTRIDEQGMWGVLMRDTSGVF